jgi:hypothetical protein
MSDKYTGTLPSGMQVEITIPGPMLLVAANLLYEENKAAGYTYQDCLVMRALTAIDGQPVTAVDDAIKKLDVQSYGVLRIIVESMVAPNKQMIDAMAATVRKVVATPVDQPPTTYSVDEFKGDGRTTSGTAPAQGDNVPYQPNPYYSPVPHAPATA